jgi:hypothetical protein
MICYNNCFSSKGRLYKNNIDPTLTMLVKGSLSCLVYSFGWISSFKSDVYWMV